MPGLKDKINVDMRKASKKGDIETVDRSLQNFQPIVGAPGDIGGAAGSADGTVVNHHFIAETLAHQRPVLTVQALRIMCIAVNQFALDL